MKTKKATALWMSFISLLAIYFVTLFNEPEILKIIAGSIIWAIVTAGGIYQGANVTDNGVKGKYFRPELNGTKFEGE